MFKRSLHLPLSPKNSFFLWGPRQAGKSTLLKTTYPNAKRIDLLKTDEFLRYTERPFLIREELQSLKTPNLIIIDEIQKIPSLLDEVHWLIENSKTTFALCGSSARKLRKGHANLLGGRATRYELFGLVSEELKNDFDLIKILNRGYLPRHYVSEEFRLLMRSYVEDYLKEEIANEGLVRNLPSFSNFLSSSVLSDTELVNFSTISRDCGVSVPTVREYFQILVDTLLGSYLPSYTKRPKRRVIQTPKFYFGDVGVVNYLAKRGWIEPGSELFGKAFENWIHHELKSYIHYRQLFSDLSYWRLASGIEVDFIINDVEYAIESKSSAKITSDHLKGLRQLAEEHCKVKKKIVVSLEAKKRTTDDEITIYPYQEFVQKLWNGGIF